MAEGRGVSETVAKRRRVGLDGDMAAELCSLIAAVEDEPRNRPGASEPADRTDRRTAD
jgi:hypothetical protein